MIAQPHALTPALPTPDAVTASRIPLSYAQQGLWLLDQLQPGGAAYNVPVAMTINGPLDVEALRSALREVIRRHDALRTTIRTAGAAPYQHVADSGDVVMTITDLTTEVAEDHERAARFLVDQLAAEPFDLAEGPLIRTQLIKLAAERHVFVLVMHHVVCDGPSLHLLFDELATLYAGGSAASGPTLPALTAQYADYAVHQHTHPASEVDLDWWCEHLAGAPTTLAVPADRARPARYTSNGATHVSRIPAATAEALGVVSRTLRSSPFMIVTAAYAALLGRVCGTDDLLIGTPVGRRSTSELEPLIGFFVNTVPLRIDLAGDPTFGELVKRVRTETFAALEHQHVPFEQMVEALKLERNLSHTPLIQTVLTFEPRPMVEPRLGDLGIDLWTLEADAAKFELDLMIVRAADGSGDLELSITYSTDLFDRSTIVRLADALHRFLAAGAADPALPIRSLPLLDELDRAAILIWGTGAPARSGSGPRMDDLVAAHAAATPDAPAVSGTDGTTLTYAELLARADAIAGRLQDAGVQPGDIVGVLLPKIVDLPAALLGVLRAGAAYLPLDPVHPVGHLERVLGKAGARHVVTDASGASRLAAADVTAIDLDRPGPNDTSHVPVPGHPEQLAYVIFTSGSTGEPKGVAIPHRGLINHSLAMRDDMRLTAADRVLQFSNIGFDVATEEIFPTWLAGACVVLAPEPTPPPAELAPVMARTKITVADLPASYWQQWVARLSASDVSTLRLLLVGSERVDPAALVSWQRITGIPVINSYGLTENTITAIQQYVGEQSPDAPVPIGRPIDGFSTYVLDRHLQLVPPGVRGDLYLSGAGLARGYLNRPDLTAERFVPNPFSTEPGARMLRTGDVARWRPDGMIELVGRADHQLKVRGYRIEPGDVEAALRSHPDVAESAVSAHPGPGGVLQLVGYVVPRAGTAVPDDLRPYLSRRLPVHLVPSALVALAVLPTTASGKVDRNALPAPKAGPAARCGTGSAVASTDLERAISALWQQILDSDRVGVDDNFFDLGGTSLGLATLHSKLTELIGRRLPVVTLYEHPTIGALARHLSAAATPTAGDASVDADRIRSGRARLARQRRQTR